MHRPYSIAVSTPPSVEPLTIAEAKSHLRLETSTDDVLVASYVKAAREYVEDIGNLALVDQGLTLRLDQFPGQWPYGFPGQYDYVPRRTTLTWAERYVIDVPRAPLKTVTSIQYVDIGGTPQTVDPALYQVDPYQRPGRILPAYGQTWPIARAQSNAVTIVLTAGFGADGSAVPESIRQLIRLLVAHQYELRNPIVVGTIVNELPHAIQTLLWQTRALTVAA